MKQFLLFVLAISLFFTNNNFAQCPGCNINNTLTTPGIYPNPLPDGTQGQPFDEDVTFVMLTDTSGLTVNYFKILAVNNLPFGLDWQCNNSGNGCQYDPQVSIYGCVKVCGTPLQTGTFTIAVDVVANLQVVGDQYSTINIGLTILPASGGNSGFTYNPLGGCDSASIDFTALITNPTNPVIYNWDFGNGNTGTQLNENQNYTSPGDYQVTLQTEILGFVLTNVTVNSVNDNWCGDVEEPSLPFVGCTGDPDLVFSITDAGGNTLYTSSELTDQSSGSWSGLNVALNNPPFSISITDIDVISQNDNLGTFSFNGNTTGIFPFTGAGGTSGSLTIATSVIASFNDTSTIHIYPSPDKPIIAYSPNDTMCYGDSIILSISNPNAYSVQWYQSGLAITNATNDQLTVSSTGNFSVSVVSQDGCATTSDSIQITELGNFPNVTFQISGDTLHCFLTQYSLQWYLNGSAISGATNPVYIKNQSGNYYVVATNNFGCTSSSDTLFLNYNSLSNLMENIGINIFPVPVKNLLHVDLFGWNSENSIITITDLSGKIILSKSIELINNGSKKRINISTEGLENGVYLLKIQSDNSLINRKFIVQK